MELKMEFLIGHEKQALDDIKREKDRHQTAMDFYNQQLSLIRMAKLGLNYSNGMRIFPVNSPDQEKKTPKDHGTEHFD